MVGFLFLLQIYIFYVKMNIVQNERGDIHMNKTEISKEKIIEKSIQLMKDNNNADINMRKIARMCNVAVGSIYNYFPTKSQLIIAVIENVWSSVFQIDFCINNDNGSFIDYISLMYKRVYNSHKEYQNFFLEHRSLVKINSKAEGKNVMEKYILHIKRAFLNSMNEDKSINQNIWNDNFSKEKLIDFIFSNIIMTLSQGKEDCDFLIEILQRLIY